MQQGEIIPAEELQLCLARHLTRADRQGGASQIHKQVAVETHTIFEQHIVEVEVLFDAYGRLLALQAIHGGIHRLDHPQHLAAVHDVLVDEELVALVERLCRLGNDDGIIRGEGLHLAFLVLGAVHQGIYFAVDLQADHIIILCQGLGNVMDLLFVEFTMAFNEGDVGLLQSGHLLHCVDKAELEVLHRGIQGLLRRLAYLVLQ